MMQQSLRQSNLTRVRAHSAKQDQDQDQRRARVPREDHPAGALLQSGALVEAPHVLLGIHTTIMPQIHYIPIPILHITTDLSVLITLPSRRFQL